MRISCSTTISSFLCPLSAISFAAQQPAKPNILVIFGEDIGRTLDTFKDFPPRQRAASFSIDQAVEAMKKGLGELN
jgi:hypothetical protein